MKIIVGQLNLNLRLKSMDRCCHILFWLLISFVLITGCGRNKSVTAIQWNPWQHTLKATGDPEIGTASVNVVFTGPEGANLSTCAFTDDGKVFHFRTAFPASGTWHWVTTSSNTGDRGLHNKKGRVRVAPYTGENPLFKHGDLRVSENGRYLEHADGTPFLWTGETGWRSTQMSTISEWHDYIDTRTDQRFTLIQISPRGVSKKSDVELADVSFRKDGTPDPLFWHDLETKISYANEKGLFVFMVGTGKFWKDHFARNPGNQVFETYITGRLAGLMVIFSPSFDELYNSDNDSIAARLNKLTTHLVTQHPGTNYDANLRYGSSPSVDFYGLQSGHHGGRLERAYNAARAWTLDMWNRTPVKPVINIEAMYDAYGSNNAGNWREKDARKLGWITWLSGSRGYTYGAGDVPPKVPVGAGGIWRFNKDSTTYDYWRKAMLWPSSGQITIMHDFLDTIEWWLLVPSHDLILNQAENDTLKMVASKSSKGDLLLAYLPDNPSIDLDLKDFRVNLKARWFNPVSGKFISSVSPVIPGNNVSFTKPAEWEDALLLLTKEE